MNDIIRVYKFYGKKYGLDNLSKQRLKISTLDDLNDPFEFLGVSFPTEESRKIWEQTRDSIFSNKGIICFCKDWSNPVIWSHYAEAHKGLALGFDIPAEESLSVQYRKTRRKFSELTKMDTSNKMELIQTSLATKFKHWKYENEIRIFVRIEDTCPETGLSFKDFDDDLKLREIIIGPLSDITSAEIRKTADIGTAAIITSRLAFNSYKVTRQRKLMLQK